MAGFMQKDGSKMDIEKGLYGNRNATSSYFLFNGDSERIVRIEKKLDVLLDQVGISFDDQYLVSKQVWDAIKSGNKLKAIRLHREETGVSLKSAISVCNALKRIQKKSS